MSMNFIGLMARKKSLSIGMLFKKFCMNRNQGICCTTVFVVGDIVSGTINFESVRFGSTKVNFSKLHRNL
ncbi:hypothetical protein [Planococcus sp. S3-L1]|uniref:hypothetical protein n=1 Tax=Planococcus sp. S3-L1 TaxID=3046200 RepID=UPI0024BA62CC|nr:hypothetical protein [Planococcus sp. S3-L1]MDJ0332901.1 hypothetical protein [Planococcus sp. S3-L1]